MKSSREMEVAITEGTRRLERECVGRGPRDVRAYVVDDLLVIRLQAVLNAAERHLINGSLPERGRDLLKEVRRHFIETARPTIEDMIARIAGVGVLSMHYDISTVTGEEVVLLVLSEPPLFGETKDR